MFASTIQYILPYFLCFQLESIFGVRIYINLMYILVFRLGVDLGDFSDPESTSSSDADPSSSDAASPDPEGFPGVLTSSAGSSESGFDLHTDPAGIAEEMKSGIACGGMSTDNSMSNVESSDNGASGQSPKPCMAEVNSSSHSSRESSAQEVETSSKANGLLSALKNVPPSAEQQAENSSTENSAQVRIKKKAVHLFR